MLANIRSIFRPPVFEDVEITRLAGLFNVILLATFGVALLACFGIVIFIPEQINQLLVMTVILPLIVLMLYLMRRGSVHLAIKIYTVSLWLVLTLLTIVFGGIHTPAFTSYVLVILIAGLLWSGRAAVYFAILTAVVGFAIAVLEILGLMVMPIYTTTPISTWVGQTANLTLISFFLYQTRDSLEQALNRARNEVSIRKRIEGALRQGETQLRYVLDTVPEGVMLLDNDGRINLANPVADKLLAILARTDAARLFASSTFDAGEPWLSV
jgi:PAS domain-containing protein